MRSTACLQLCLLFVLLVLSTLPCFGSLDGSDMAWDMIEAMRPRLWACLWWSLATVAVVVVAFLKLDCLIVSWAFGQRRKDDTSTLTPDDLPENPPTGGD